MKSGTCPKCKSTEVYTRDTVPGAYGRCSLPISWFHAGHLVYYACAACGYLESYLRREKDRLGVAEKWQKA